MVPGVDGGVAIEGGVVVVDGGLAAEEGGVAVLLPPVTLMASFWPPSQWPVNVHVKKCSPAVSRVILTGGLVYNEMVELVLHEL